MSKVSETPELFPVSFFAQPGWSLQLPGYADVEKEALLLMNDWVKNYLCGPHTERPGKVCPFVPAAITMNRISMGVYRTPIGEDPVTEESVVLKAIEECLKGRLMTSPPPKPGTGDFYNSILLAFPHENYEGEEGPLKELRILLKALYLHTGTMSAIFNVPYDRALHYYQVNAPRCPSLPVLALRYMVRGDDLFIGHKDEWLAWYAAFYPDCEE